MPQGEVTGAAGEGYALHTGREGHDALRLRRLVLSAGKAQARGTDAHGLAHAPPLLGAIRKARRGGAGGRSRSTPSVGAIFGATLKSVLEYAGVRPAKAEVVAALRHVLRFFEPTRDDAARVRGGDRDHLLNGLLAHRVCNAQRRHLPESHEPAGARSYLGRNGLKDVAVGATAAVLAAHHLMSARGARADGLVDGLQHALDRVSELLELWPVGSGTAEAWHLEALRAEERALQRSRSAAVAAIAAARAQGLPPHAALALRLEWMRAAAWPRGVACDAATHAALCETLATHGTAAAVDSGGGGPAMAPPPLALPLSALPTSAWLGSASDAGSGSSSDGSRSDATSLASSASSAGSVDGADARAEADAEARRTADEACRLLACMT